MTAKLINGKAIANSLKQLIKTRIDEATRLGQERPGLAVILVGENPASCLYVKHKRAACEEVGIQSFYYPLPADVSQNELLALIQRLNQDSAVHGILVQAPLPPHLNPDLLYETISPKKDVDGFHPENVGKLAQRRPALRPCTPLGIIVLLEHIGEIFKGRHAVVVGASNIVGRPMALELLLAGATVTVCHRFTQDLAHFVNDADMVIAAAGKPNLIKGEWVKEGATVIDVGQNHLPNGQLAGDVDFAVAKEKAAWITPVPGGVGPMTVTMLLFNTLYAAGYDRFSLLSGKNPRHSQE